MTLLVCDDHKAQYNQGTCGKPIEQFRFRFTLWFSYGVDVATDLAGIQLPCFNAFQTYLTLTNSHVLSVLVDMESCFAQHAKAWHILAFW